MRKGEPNTSLGLAGRHLLGETPATRICHTLLVPPNDSLPSGTNPKICWRTAPAGGGHAV